jgi:hypothetical protein
MPFDGDGHYYEFGTARPTRGRPALFLDRDGVSIEDRHDLKDSAEVCSFSQMTVRLPSLADLFPA